MPPSVMPLPPRAGAFRYSDEDVQAILNLFGTLPRGHVVALQDAPEDSENKARRKCQIVREQIEALPARKHTLNAEDDLSEYGDAVQTEEDGTPFVMVPVIDPEFYVRGHVMPQGTPDGDGKYPGYMPAVSLSKRAEQATQDAAEPDAAAPELAAEPEPERATQDAAGRDAAAPEPTPKPKPAGRRR
jgi:hypothetical protein